MRYIHLFTCIPVFPVDFPKLQEYDIYQGGNKNIMKLKKIWSVIKGILSYCVKYRPYMAIWMIFCASAGVYTAILKGDVFIPAVNLALAFIPFVIKKMLLFVSRIGGANRYDEKLFGKKPRGRFVNYMAEYIGERE